jgi:hypothetical protein
MTERSYRALKSRKRSMVEELGAYVCTESLPRRAALLAGLIAELPASGTATK